MIRINLLGRARPKAQRKAVPLEATLQVVFFFAALLFSSGVLYYHWHSMNQEALELQAHIRKQEGEKARLEQLKAQVDQFERQRVVLQQRISVIEQCSETAPADRSFWMPWPIPSPAPIPCGSLPWSARARG